MKQLLLLPLVFLFISVTTTAQTPETVLQTVQQKYTAEKIYLHYDKSFYVAGETIWFKAYLMEGYSPSVKSTVIAVELLNDSGRLISKKILPVSGSAAIGEFSLPKTMAEGSYTIKAYTRTLMNFGFENFYYHHLNIYNPGSTNADATAQAAIYQLSFLPESGNMVGAVKNKVAFKCTDQYGNPKDVEGKITDANGKDVLSFKSEYDGMGTFEFIPNASEKYMADCIINGTDKKIQSLPVAQSAGVVLNVSRNETKTSFVVDATTVTNPALFPDYILGVMENIVAFKIAIPNTAKRMNAEIPISQLPSGILQLTVFNKENKPLAERLVFINTGDYLPEGGFRKNETDVKPRAKNSFSFELADTTAGSFSVSVTEAETENKPADNILSRFLLTSDIKGFVHNPAYYFESNDMQHQQRLDYVMLTNGWRRYSWNELLSGNLPSMSFKDPGYVSFSGHVIDPSGGNALINADITVIAKTKDKKTDFLILTTDSVGNFLMDGLTFEDTAKFYFQSSLTKNSRIKTTLALTDLSNIFYNLKTPLPKSSLEIPDSKLKVKLQDGYNFNKLAKFDGILLDEVRVKARLKSEKEKYEQKYVSSRMGSAAKVLDFLSEPPTSNQNVFAYLQSKINGVNISGGPLDYSIVYRNSRSLMGGPIQMNIFLDEMPVTPAQVATMQISEVAMVRVYPASGYSGGAGGALAIYTKRGDAGQPAGNPEHKEFVVEGFSPTKEFFSPNYASNNEAGILTDERTTLYWNPYLLTNAKNKSIDFSFYNSDKAKKFKVVLEGILENGKLLHIEKLVE